MKYGFFCIILSVLLAGVLPGVALCAQGAELPPKIPVSIKADKLDYDRTNDIYNAGGNVVIEQGTIRLEAEHVVLNNRTGEASAVGKVFLKDKADSLRADKLEFNLNTGAGIIYNGQIFMSKGNLHLKGEKIQRISETVYHVENGIFTTCDEEEWYLKAREMNVDLNKYATAKGVSFNMAGLPTFYTPYFLFPVRRQTGLLIPEPGYSSRDGFLFKEQFFWAISDNRDLTLYSDYRARRGLGTGVEYRYVNSRDSSGKLFYNFFTSFDQYRSPVTPAARWELKFEHTEEFAEDITAHADINMVGDPFYYRDLETRIELRSRPYLDSNVFYIERWDTAALYLLGQYSTNLTTPDTTATIANPIPPLTNPVFFPKNTVQKLPELRYSIFEEKIAGPVHLNFDGSAVNFTSREGDGLRRADFNPSLTAPLGFSGISFVPRVGFRATFYDQGLSTTEPVQRKYFYGGADLNARISRVYGSDSESGIGRIRHSIEPVISYMYIPDVTQEGIPQIDTIDSNSAQNLVSIALINRLTARYKDATGLRTYDMMVLKISESYDFKEARKDTVTVHPRSALKGEIHLKTPKVLSFTAQTSYDTYNNRFNTSSENLKVDIQPVRFNLSHQITHAADSAAGTHTDTKYVIGGVGFKAGKWDLFSQLWRDLELRKTTQQEYRVHYASQCWGVQFAYVKQEQDTQYLIKLDLSGMGVGKFL